AGCESEPEDATSIATPIDRPVVVQDVSPEPNLAPTQIMTASHVSSSVESTPDDVKSVGFTPTYRLFSWNVESDGADSKVIAEQLKEMNPDEHYDIFALTEVLPQDLKVYQMALGSNYQYAYSKSGSSDRLEILYNEDKFELVQFMELKEINILGRYRAPLIVHLRDRETKVEFQVMVNHLARGKAEIRQQQATMLVEWARDQTLPVFALGDYNFDYVFSTRKGNEGFVNMMRDNIWKWIEPETLIDTNWYDNPREPDGIDDYPGSMLDFAFVAGPAKNWKATCKIIVRDGDFPDDKSTSDHRPYELLIAN
ncbi:MAG: endonuclease/exonuclease/phosphatase family metal-dependent hydrolase, partial [Mariniblastus sp.]